MIIVNSCDELLDLLAEAALKEPPAAQAYALLRNANPGILSLETRQRLIANRKTGNA